MTTTAATHRRFRFPGVWFGTTMLSALLLFLYNHLDDIARQTSTPFYYPLIDQLTGTFGAALLFPFARWMVRRFPLRRDQGAATMLQNAAWHLGALLLFSVVHTTWNWTTRLVLFRVLGLGTYDYGLMTVRYWMEFPIDVILYSLFSWGVTLFDRVAAQREAALRAAQLESQLRQAQLQGLRLQLQPHFLFNALNTISSTMYDDPRAADTMLARLAELLRVSLRTTQTQEVPLATELEVLDHYVALLRARFGDRLSLRIDVDPQVQAALVPSLILQPLLENAVRHGNLSRLGIGRIDVRARAIAGNRLRIEVEDDGPGPQAGVDVTTKGIGLSGTIERLRLLYGEAQRFEMETDAAGFHVAFELPMSPSTSPSDAARANVAASDGDDGFDGQDSPDSPDKRDSHSKRDSHNKSDRPDSRSDPDTRNNLDSRNSPDTRDDINTPEATYARADRR